MLLFLDDIDIDELSLEDEIDMGVRWERLVRRDEMDMGEWRESSDDMDMDDLGEMEAPELDETDIECLDFREFIEIGEI